MNGRSDALIMGFFATTASWSMLSAAVLLLVLVLVFCAALTALSHVQVFGPITRPIIAACVAVLSALGLRGLLGSEMLLVVLLPYAGLALVLVLLIFIWLAIKLWRRWGRPLAKLFAEGPEARQPGQSERPRHVHRD